MSNQSGIAPAVRICPGGITAPPNLTPGQERRVLDRRPNEAREDAVERAKLLGWWGRATRVMPWSTATRWIWHLRAVRA